MYIYSDISISFAHRTTQATGPNINHSKRKATAPRKNEWLKRTKLLPANFNCLHSTQRVHEYDKYIRSNLNQVWVTFSWMQKAAFAHHSRRASAIENIFYDVKKQSTSRACKTVDIYQIENPRTEKEITNTHKAFAPAWTSRGLAKSAIMITLWKVDAFASSRMGVGDGNGERPKNKYMFYRRILCNHYFCITLCTFVCGFFGAIEGWGSMSNSRNVGRAMHCTGVIGVFVSSFFVRSVFFFLFTIVLLTERYMRFWFDYWFSAHKTNVFILSVRFFFVE